MRSASGRWSGRVAVWGDGAIGLESVRSPKLKRQADRQRETNRTYDAASVSPLAGSSSEGEVSILSRNCCNRS